MVLLLHPCAKNLLKPLFLRVHFCMASSQWDKSLCVCVCVRKLKTVTTFKLVQTQLLFFFTEQ